MKNVSLLLLALLSFVYGDDVPEKKEYQTPEYVQYVNEVRRDFGTEMGDQLNLEVTGSGSSMPHDVEEIEVRFAINRRATLEEARAIEIEAIDRFLHRINCHEKLRPFLREYPFTPSRVNVAISYNNDRNDVYSDGTVTYTSIIKGKIFYSGYDPIQGKLINIHVEPYEEARAIVQNNPTQNLLVHQPSPYEARLDKLLKNFEKEVKKKYGLICSRDGGKLANGIEEIAFNFKTSKRTSLDKARELEVKITERLLQIVNADEAIRPHLKEYPFTATRVKVGITIQKEPFEYYTDGSVAKVVPQDGKLLYLGMRPATKTRFPIHPDIVICEESFEEAKSALKH